MSHGERGIELLTHGKSPQEVRALVLAGDEGKELAQTSVLAYRDGVPVGMLYVLSQGTAGVILKPGRIVQEAEKLNVLGIGVREAARGQGVNLAMAAYGFSDLMQRGATHLSYTLVYDDNWPSRRTAEKLGAFVSANYLTYRRTFRRNRDC